MSRVRSPSPAPTFQNNLNLWATHHLPLRRWCVRKCARETRPGPHRSFITHGEIEDVVGSAKVHAEMPGAAVAHRVVQGLLQDAEQTERHIGRHTPRNAVVTEFDVHAFSERRTLRRNRASRRPHPDTAAGCSACELPVELKRIFRPGWGPADEQADRQNLGRQRRHRIVLEFVWCGADTLPRSARLRIAPHCPADRRMHSPAALFTRNRPKRSRPPRGTPVAQPSVITTETFNPPGTPCVLRHGVGP